jgi:DNA-binding response OmpR family regulator
MYKILLADTDADALNVMEDFLNREGYHVIRATSTRDVLNRVERDTPQLCIVNTQLSRSDAADFCYKLRANPKAANMPIIFLTEPNSAYRVDEVLSAGGDDYIRKPFALRELAARIRAHLRRVSHQPVETVPTLRFMPENLTVYVNDRSVNLTQVEFDLLVYMSQSPHHLHSTQDLLTDVWQYPRGTGDSALVRNHVRNLRRKLEDDPERPAIIQSRHGRGYAIKAKVQFPVIGGAH